MPTIAIASTGRTPATTTSASLPALLELLAVVAVIAWLLPVFTQIADSAAGRDRRFAAAGLRIEGLPDGVLPALCANHAPHAQASVRVRLCSSSAGVAPSSPTTVLPAVLAQAAAQAAQAFSAPMRVAAARLDALRARQHDGDADVREMADAIAVIEAEVQPFVERFQLAQPAASTGPAPLACAVRWVEAALTESSGTPTGGPAGTTASSRSSERSLARTSADPLLTTTVPARATVADLSRATAVDNAVLLLGAALDGRSITESVANAALLPVVRARPAAPCDAGSPGALTATAALMGDARLSVSNARKNEATLALMQSAGSQWAGAMGLGYAMLLWSRRAQRPAFGVAAALALWALAAWGARVPWPLAGHRGFEPARLDAALSSPPAAFVLWLGAAAALVLAWASVASWRRPTAPGHRTVQTMSSRVGYAGFVAASGLGWLLLLELSANGHPANRYLALYHQGHLWLGLLIFSVLLFLRRPLARECGWLIAVGGETLRSAARRFGPCGTGAAFALLAFGGVVALGLLLSNMRQLTSELGRMWLIVGAAWFFFLRAGPLTERLAQSGRTGVSFWRYAWPMLFVVAVLIAAMLVTRDMGPLLIAGYASGAFLAATLAMWWHQRTGQRVSAFVLAVLLFTAWIGGVTVALFETGSIDGLTATRLESVAAPFASTNDQLALVAWFQRAAPTDGFGIGAVPWCGFASNGGCSGVPAQVHSDYTFTAIVGVFGPLAAWAASLACALWLHRLIRHHGRVTRGEPRLLHGARGSRLDGQAFLSWIAVAWVVLTSCQLAVTVAGNVAVLPLTGVTFPFVSFGMTSLLVNLAFLALCLNVDATPRGAHG